MVHEWYYAHDKEKLGPYTSTELKELAAAGAILPVDTVWQEGNENGVPASRVRYLFACPPADVLPAAAPVEPTPAPAIASINPSPAAAVENHPTSPALAKAPPKVPSRGRAVAQKGADLVGQDGVQARYRKKCITCGHKDSSTHMISITNKVFKANFFCPKCRKRREVVIQCFSK